MPMIDAYAQAGTFADNHQLAVDLATTVMTIEEVPNIPMFRKNTAAFIHELPADTISNVDGETNYVRVQVLTNAGALDRHKQLAVVRQLTDVIAKAANDPGIAERTWTKPHQREAPSRPQTQWRSPCQLSSGQPPRCKTME